MSDSPFAGRAYPDVLAEQAAQAAADQETGLEGKTVEQLRDLARDLGITGYSGLLKDDLKARIRAVQEAPESLPPAPPAEEAGGEDEEVV